MLIELTNFGPSPLKVGFDALVLPGSLVHVYLLSAEFTAITLPDMDYL